MLTERDKTELVKLFTAAFMEYNSGWEKSMRFFDSEPEVYWRLFRENQNRLDIAANILSRLWKIPAMEAADDIIIYRTDFLKKIGSNMKTQHAD